MELVILFASVLVVDLVAVWLGVDSRDGVGSAEWRRREEWPGVWGKK